MSEMDRIANYGHRRLQQGKKATVIILVGLAVGLCLCVCAIAIGISVFGPLLMELLDSILVPA